MAATAAMVAKLRRYIDEPNTDVYDDDTLETYIESYPTLDALGTKPLEVDYTTSPPTLSEVDDWIPTYDLHAAAAEIWQEKSASFAQDYNVTADGSTLARSQVQEQFLKQSRYHSARRKASTMTLQVEPRVSPDEESNDD